MNDRDRDIAREAAIKEAISLGAVVVIVLAQLWIMGEGRMLYGGIVERIRIARERRQQRFDGEVRQFAREVSDWDHEQAAKPHRPPAAGGGCLFGCH